jgi:hypothetical protein
MGSSDPARVGATTKPPTGEGDHRAAEGATGCLWQH